MSWTSPLYAAMLAAPLMMPMCDGCDKEDDRPVDADGDGFAAADDCDDQNAAAYPGADEICDQVDNDCNGFVDEQDPNLQAKRYFADTDRDGFGAPGTGEVACRAASGRVANDADCDDRNRRIHPDADEVCDAIDNDCDGRTDLDDNSLDVDTLSVFFVDQDGDGYGSLAKEEIACTVPRGFADNATDCDDSARRVHPGATEICDAIDNDCDFAVDDADASLDLSSATTWFADADADGFGVDTQSVQQCLAPQGYAPRAGDCADSIARIFPGAAELCDGLANDCDTWSSWTPALESGLASFVDASTGAGWDLTHRLVVGADGAVPTWAVDADGELGVCGAFAAQIDAGSHDLVVRGRTDDASLDAHGSGTLLSVDGGSLEVHDILLRGGSGDEGGGIAARYADVRIVASTLSNHEARRGGAVFIGQGASLHASESRVEQNVAEDHGGGIAARRAGRIELNDVAFQHNAAGAYGGAVGVLESQGLAVRRGSFRDNGARHGGAVAVVRSNALRLETVQIEDNRALRAGGAVYGEDLDMLEVRSTLFDANGQADPLVAVEGAALYGSADEVLIHGSRFTRHEAGVGVRASTVAIDGASPARIAQSSFEQNRNDGTFGAVIAAEDTEELELVDSRFVHNTTSADPLRENVPEIRLDDGTTYNLPEFVFEMYCGETHCTTP